MGRENDGKARKSQGNEFLNFVGNYNDDYSTYRGNHSDEMEEIKDTPLWDQEKETLDIGISNDYVAKNYYSGDMDGTTYLTVTGSQVERSGNIQCELPE